MKITTLFAGCCALMFTAFTAKSQIINTVAGNGTQGYTGDGGQATAAELENPVCLAFDASGNYYFSDETDNVIRMVNMSTGIITTVAGTGSATFSGNGGLATAAGLDWPIGVAFDTAGNFYISELVNNDVRQVNKSTGIITAFAGMGAVTGFYGDGGPATAAELYNARYIAIDKKGNLYIGDAGNNRVRMVNTSGIISTFAGNGIAGFSGDGGQASSAELDYPYGVALDDSDNVYIADQSNNRIREIRAATGIITTIAGNGTAAHSGDGGQATAAEINAPATISVAHNGDVFIAGTSEETVRKVTRATSIISTFAGNTVAGYSGDGGAATAAELHFPCGVTLDHNGNLYVPDWGNYRVRFITMAESTEGIQTLNNNSGISVYPNPASQQIYIAFNGIQGRATVTLYNVLGQQILTDTRNSGQTLELNTASLIKGIYLVKVQTEDGSIYVQKVEIIR